MLTEAVKDTHQILHSRFLTARNETDALFQIVRPEAMYDRPIPERHRIAFYVGHLEAFDWNLFAGPALRRLSSIGFLRSESIPWMGICQPTYPATGRGFQSSMNTGTRRVRESTD